jgi:F0F1-type ATP synthase membrane subunit c/vacuolar-type H+-ATPase subunit K
VAGPDLLVLLVLLPLIAWASSLVALVFLLRASATHLSPQAHKLPPARFAVIHGYGATPVVLGIVLWIVLQPAADRLAISSSPGSQALKGLVLWVAYAYAVSAGAAILARSSVIHARSRLLSGRDYGRVLVFAALPLSAVVFAVIIGFLVKTVVDGFFAGVISSGARIAGSAIPALQAFSIGVLAYPVAAFVSARVHNLSSRGFTRILLILAAGEVPAVFGLLLTVQALYPLTS